LYPTSVLVTGFDIIFFWVARMIMMGLKFAGDVPFREVYITGLIRDENGDKMSKSKGNIIDPLDLIDGIDLESLVAKRTFGLMQPKDKDKIEKATRKQFPSGIPSYGADALRFTFCALATMGRDIRFDLGRIEGYRNFCNKLWNAARYAMMNLESAPPAAGQDARMPGAQGGAGPAPKTGPVEYSVADRWIRSRLGATIEEVRARLADYRFDLAAQALYEFAWYEYCDWYLELSKPTLQSEQSSDAQKRGTRETLATVLEAYLRLLHPLMPFITEEIWQSVAPLAGRKGDTIMLQSYPTSAEFARDAAAEAAITPIKAAILGARQIRGQLDIPQAREIALAFQSPEAADEVSLSANLDVVRGVGKISEFKILPSDAALPPSATAIIDRRTISSPLAGLISDPQAELARLSKRKAKIEQDLKKEEAKFANPNFVANAKPEVVALGHERIAEFKRQIAQLEEQQKQVGDL
jgi:valyl-tRNA synthetase